MFNTTTSEKLHKKVYSSGQTLLDLISDLEEARNQAVLADVEAQKEIDELEMVRSESEEIRKKADKLLKLLE